MLSLSTDTRNAVLSSLYYLIEEKNDYILTANEQDLRHCDQSDKALYDRLKLDSTKIQSMLRAIESIRNAPDPVGQIRYQYDHPQGMHIIDKTAPFGTILIIYESRPDVTIEAAIVAFKADSRILLKGGKEALYSNRALVQCWHEALAMHDIQRDAVQLLEWDRQATQDFLKNPTSKIDLIVPRGGDKLIAFVKEHATCPVLISGRGNNFIYVHDDADWDKVLTVILNAKTNKISACNALDKVLINQSLPHIQVKLTTLLNLLSDHGVDIRLDPAIPLKDARFRHIADEQEWYTEYLDMKIAVGSIEDIHTAVGFINKYSGGHSVGIMTESEETAGFFMERIDAAAVYHNTSTRFTDGGEMGIGAELAISTDKLHHRGPLGLNHLVTNKWFIYGNGQVR